MNWVNSETGERGSTNVDQLKAKLNEFYKDERKGTIHISTVIVVLILLAIVALFLIF